MTYLGAGITQQNTSKKYSLTKYVKHMTDKEILDLQAKYIKELELRISQLKEQHDLQQQKEVQEKMLTEAKRMDEEAKKHQVLPNWLKKQPEDAAKEPKKMPTMPSHHVCFCSDGDCGRLGCKAFRTTVTTSTQSEDKGYPSLMGWMHKD